MGVLLVMAAGSGLVLGCSGNERSAKDKAADAAKLAAWVKAGDARKAQLATSTTTPGRVTTTIPPTTSTMPPLVRLALSKAFQEAAEARRLAEARCRQLAGRPRC